MTSEDWSPVDPFTDPRVASARQTSAGAPEQYDGTLIDGRYFFFSYKHGAAYLGLGRTLDLALNGADAYQWLVSDGSESEFSSPRERDEVFAEMLDGLTNGEWINEVTG